MRNFTVEVTDPTGIASDLTAAYNTSGPLCLSVTSDPVPDVCFPFSVSVMVSNDIGTTSIAQTFTSDLGEMYTKCLDLCNLACACDIWDL